MGIYTSDLRDAIVRPTLELLDEWSPSAENLLMGTAAQETQLGNNLQGNNHTGLGLYRISPHTHTQIWDNFLVHDPELASRLRGLASQQQFLKSPHNELIVNLAYATGIAWMIYKRHALTLLNNLSVHELAQCWLSYYCTRDEHSDQIPHNKIAEIDNFVRHYRHLVLRDNKNIAA
jgi:hypothetical protein